MPKVSIVLPTYNGEKFLSKSIESVIKQTFNDWELIIVNDCSTDSSLVIAEKYAQIDSRIKVISNEENKKLPASLNIGFNEASGEYYTWTSDDNEYYPEAIETMVLFLDRNKDYGMVYSVCKTVNLDNDSVGSLGNIAITPTGLLESNFIGACFLYRSDVAKKVGLYDKNHFLAEDHDYWLRLYKISKIAHMEEELYLYRCHKNSLTAKNTKNAQYISRNLAIKYYKEYAKVFPAYAIQINRRWQLMEALINEDNILYDEIKIKYDKRSLFKEMKCLYKLQKSEWLKKKIFKLGGKYIFKSLKF